LPAPVIVNWNGLDQSKQADIIPILESTDNWLIFTHPLGLEKTIAPQSQLAPKVFSTTQKGKSVGKKGGSACTGTDRLASYGLDDQPIAVLTDTKGFMIVSSNWVGEGKDPVFRHSPDGNILARIMKVLHQRVDLGLSIFIRIRARRGEFFNEKADRWADE